MKTLSALLLAAGLAVVTPARATMPATPGGIAWAEAMASKDIDAAFARAKSEKKPVLLYWGAVWCPPCNQLKATLFNRQDFIALSRAVLPVHLDGDLPGAQQLGTRFKVVGYPTLILFAPDGTELTRLPGEADPIRIVESMQRTLSGARSTRAILDDARAGKKLPNTEWQALAFYSWGTDEAQLASDGDSAGLLAELAEKSVAGGAEPAVATRLWLKSIAARADEVKNSLATPETRQRLLAILGDAAQVRQNADVVLGGSKSFVTALSVAGTAERTELLGAVDGALRQLQTDMQLSRADRMDALIGRVGLARIDHADSVLNVDLPASLLAEVRTHVALMDKEITSGYERQAVMTSAGYLLRFAGLPDESNALLKANLKKSHSPYYLMSQLAGNAKLQGRADDALNWHEKAYKESKGPATRLQWGATYVGALFDLAPGDTKRIERAVGQVLTDAGKDSGAFYDRSSRSLKKIAARVAKWEQKDAQQRLRERFAGLCRALPAKDPQRATCEAVWPVS